MYFTAASAAWRYSGNVTGPLSRFSSPSVIGAPAAFLGVPSASAAGAAAVEDDAGLAVVLDELSSLLPQPAATTATMRANTMTSGRRSDFTVASFLVKRRQRRRGNWT